MANQINFSYNGMKQDIAKSKHPREFYWDALNIQVTATESQTAAVLSNEKGNSLMVTIPNLVVDTSKSTISYNNKKLTYRSDNGLDAQFIPADLTGTDVNVNNNVIIGMAKGRNSLIVFTTNDKNINAIWEVNNILEDNQEIELIYLRKMGLSTERPVQIEFNYENENIQKIYWIDGSDQIKSLNTRHDKIKGNGRIIDINLDSVNFVGNVSFVQPVVTDVLAGGNHTAGVIQYAYNLYRLNSSQTKISPLSERVALGKQVGGGEVNEIVGSTPIVQINDLDTTYDSVQVYAIKYTSFNQSPAISLIADRKIDGPTLTIYDDGSSISEVGIDEFIFLGSDPLIPQHIATKDSRMFLFNIKTKNFVLPEELDMRAYGCNVIGSAVIMDNVTASGSNVTGAQLTVPANYNVPYTHDSINRDYGVYKFQRNGTTVGGEGKFLKYELKQKSITNTKGYRFFKDRELYRIAIQFYNSLGQTSLPIWIADFEAPTGNLLGNYNTLKVELKSTFTDWLNTYPFEKEEDRPIGYKILRAQRSGNDKTIVCQGIISSMMVNSPVASVTAKRYTITEKRVDSDSQPKFPDILVRNLNKITPLQGASHLRDMNFGDDNPTSTNSNTPLNEVNFDVGRRKANSYQYTTMMQMYSPEILFGNPSVSAGMKLHVIGGLVNTDNSYWGQERNIESKVSILEAKTFNGIHPLAPGVTNQKIKDNINALMDNGLIGGIGGEDGDKLVVFNQFYRKYDTFKKNGFNRKYSIYGAPEITEKGQGRTIYNNDNKYEYQNTMQGLLADGNINDGVLNVNSDNAKNLTFVLGDSNTTASFSRTTWEQLHAASTMTPGNSVFVAEFIKDNSVKYVGSLYGGFNYEAKKRTNYLAIGSFQKIADSLSLQIDSPGDTFVDNFRFERISKTDTEIYVAGTLQYTEIVEFPVETTVDLSNRNDNSFSAWDSDFQPRYDDYHKYNTVYSQETDLITETDLDYNQKIIEDFDTRIQATKVKIPNENIDSWTDFLVNDTLDIDGKYGPINAVVNDNDRIYTLQDEAVALISINPRVTISAQDGIPTELGTGQVLSDYNYLTTKSGTINKWSVIASAYGFYYFDLINQTWMRVNGQSLEDLVNTQGMNSYFRNNLVHTDLIKDNPILNTGISTGYNVVNNTVYISFLQSTNPFTISFNERTNSFISFHSFIPSFYISKGRKMITTNNQNNAIYEHGKGKFNNYYDTKFPFHITFQANPQEPDNVFNNIIYNGECYKDGVDVPLGKWTHIHVWNEYQDTNKVPLILNRNIERKFRKWRMTIPRDAIVRMDRMRGHWVKIKLSYEGQDNYEFIIHDTQLQYTSYPY